jgi:hypothetical protein
MPDFPQIIPTPAQVEAVSASFQRFGRACQVAADQIADAFTADRIGGRPFTPFPFQRRYLRYLGKLAAVVEAEQRRQQGPTIGRKRRARRARGRGRADD